MDFNTFIGKAWDEHATDTPVVAARLPEGVALATDAAQIARLATLAHHVFGEHLGEWRHGIDFIEPLAALPLIVADAPNLQSLRNCLASLALSQAGASDLAGLSVSDRICVQAMAAANLALHHAARSRGLLEQAVDAAGRSGLPVSDPMHRALAIAGNGIAGTLEEKNPRSAAERELMLLAAQTARVYWERAGTWLEVERAEYRLAMSWLQAGDLARARRHAQTCLEIVVANDGVALERFFGWEALGRVERAAADAAGHARALGEARIAFEALEDSDKGWCGESLAKLAG